MERRISRIITPGTLTDTSLLPEKDDAVLLSVSRPAGKNAVWGFAWLTLSNGDFFATEVTDEQFDSEVARISPSEVLVSEKLRDAMRETHPELTVTPMPACTSMPSTAKKLSRRRSASTTLTPGA